MKRSTPKPRTFDLMRAMILGPPKHGKTTMAATMSKDYVDGEVPDGGNIVLSDILWVPWDHGALDGLRERGMTAEVVNANLSAFTGQQLVNASTDVPAECKKWVAEKRKEFGPDADLTVVYDTGSTFAGMLESHFEQKPNGETRDGREKWGLVFNQHKRMFSNMNRLDAHVLFLFHTKAISVMGKEAEVAEAKKVKAATSVPGTFAVETDIAGKAKKFYINNMSLIFPLIAKTEKNKKPADWKRVIYPFGTQDIEGASRFVLRLDQEEKADFRVILPKLRNEGGK